MYRQRYQKLISGIVCSLAMFGLAMIASTTARAAEDAPTIRFGVPTWAGVTVQSQVAADLLEAMGYRTQQVSASPAFALNGLKTDDLDVYLGGWMPTEKDMIDPLVKKKEVVVLGTNISGALMGLAVPKYVWDAGVHTEADLNKFADRFDHKIYGIEEGTGFNTAIKQAIKENRDNLGDWKLIPSSTSAMLAQVQRSIRHDDWIVFLGWEPHSMNILWDIKYLKAVGKPKIAETRSDVLTVVNPKLVDDHPAVTRFLKQFQVPKRTMSGWILEFANKKRAPTDVASSWIGSHLDLVGKWLQGVKALDGKPAIDAVRARYGS